MPKYPKTSDLSDEKKEEDIEGVFWNREAGRPSKIGKFIDALNIILARARRALIYTDEELIFLVNELLQEEERIADDTFKTWKNEGIKDERCQAFRHLYKKALLEQKENLFDRLNDPLSQNWQRQAWQIERKFDEWNLRNKQESKVEGQMTWEQARKLPDVEDPA